MKYQQDIMKAAQSATEECVIATLGPSMCEDIEAIISAAILAERERCAKVAEAQTIYELPSHRRLVADAIRKGATT